MLTRFLSFRCLDFQFLPLRSLPPSLPPLSLSFASLCAFFLSPPLSFLLSSLHSLTHSSFKSVAISFNQIIINQERHSVLWSEFAYCCFVCWFQSLSLKANSFPLLLSFGEALVVSLHRKSNNTVLPKIAHP